MTISRSIVFVAGLLLVLISTVNATPEGKLYSFANPLPGPLKFADHTWVTDYQSRPSCPKPDANYWYSTGACHPDESDKDPRPLSSANADIGIAKCIARPNDGGFNRTATARIIYGIDGVCHQIANRILAATGSAERPPITVEGANGYKISRFFYGEYGTASQWENLRAECEVPAMPIRDAMADLTIMTAKAGLQAKMSVLQEEQNLVRRQIAEIGRRAKIKTKASGDVAKQVNAAVNASLKRLSISLGAMDFQRFFDWPAKQEIILVHPEVAAKVRYNGQ